MYIRNVDEKGRTSRHQGQIQSLHTFSFFSYFDEHHRGFGLLKAVNQDVFKPLTSSSNQKIQGHDVIFLVEKGQCTLRFSDGQSRDYDENDAILIQGGTGLDVSFENRHQKNSLRLRGFYFEGQVDGQTQVRHIAVSPKDGLSSILLPTQLTQGHLYVPDGDIKMFLWHESLGAEMTYPKKQGRILWVEILHGEIELEKPFESPDRVILQAGDALGLDEDDSKFHVRVLSGVKLVLIDMPKV